MTAWVSWKPSPLGQGGLPSLGDQPPSLGESGLGGLKFSRFILGQEQAGAPLLGHLEACLGARVCLGCNFVSKGWDLAIAGSFDSVELRGALRDLGPRERSLIVQGFSYSLACGDAKLLVSSLATLLELVSFKRHRALVSGVGRALVSAARAVHLLRGQCGLRVRISGKIGVGGNAKKRSVTIGGLGCSQSSIRSKLSLAQKQARTPTGVLGISAVVVS